MPEVLSDKELLARVASLTAQLEQANKAKLDAELALAQEVALRTKYAIEDKGYIVPCLKGDKIWALSSCTVDGNGYLSSGTKLAHNSALSYSKVSDNRVLIKTALVAETSLISVDKGKTWTLYEEPKTAPVEEPRKEEVKA